MRNVCARGSVAAHSFPAFSCLALFRTVDSTMSHHIEMGVSSLHSNKGNREDDENTRMPIISSTGEAYGRPASNYVERFSLLLVMFALALLVIIMAIVSATNKSINGIPTSNAATQVVYYPSLGLPGYESYSWTDLTSLAQGGNVTMAIDGTCCGLMANWLKTYAKKHLLSAYNINFNVVRSRNSALVSKWNTAGFLTYVEAAINNGNTKNGDIDMIWMNGANFQRAYTGLGSTYPEIGNYLYGPWATKVPSAANFDWTSTVVNSDFGVANNGYEMPAWQANFVITYRSDIMDGLTTIKTMPTSFTALAAAVADTNSPLYQKFSYPAPFKTSNTDGDNIGMGFIRHFLYEAAGGYTTFMGGYNAAAYAASVKGAFTLLTDMEGINQINLFDCKGTVGRYCDSQAALDAAYIAGNVIAVR